MHRYRVIWSLNKFTWCFKVAFQSNAAVNGLQVDYFWFGKLINFQEWNFVQNMINPYHSLLLYILNPKAEFQCNVCPSCVYLSFLLWLLLQETDLSGLQNLIKFYKSRRFDADIGLPRYDCLLWAELAALIWLFSQ